MGYLLVNSDILKEKGVTNFEVMPDGRGITDFSMLKILGSIAEVQIVSTAEEMLALIEEEKASGLYDNLGGDDLANNENIGDIPKDDAPQDETKTEGEDIFVDNTNTSLEDKQEKVEIEEPIKAQTEGKGNKPIEVEKQQTKEEQKNNTTSKEEGGTK